MKLNKIISSVILSCSLVSITHASPLFQAGNIEEGKKWSIDSKSGVASYFANGSSGQVEFTCDLQGLANGEKVNALLRTGKNFENEYNLPITLLHEGINGPFLWTLTDKKSDVGNIKVFYSSGSNVTIQCLGAKKI